MFKLMFTIGLTVLTGCQYSIPAPTKEIITMEKRVLKNQQIIKPRSIIRLIPDKINMICIAIGDTAFGKRPISGVAMEAYASNFQSLIILAKMSDQTVLKFSKPQDYLVWSQENLFSESEPEYSFCPYLDPRTIVFTKGLTIDQLEIQTDKEVISEGLYFTSAPIY